MKTLLVMIVIALIVVGCGIRDEPVYTWRYITNGEEFLTRCELAGIDTAEGVFDSGKQMRFYCYREDGSYLSVMVTQVERLPYDE